VGPDANSWHEEVLDFLTSLRERHLTDWNQVAFLFRFVRWDKAKALAHYLEEHGIPVYAPRSDFYFEREEVRLMLGAFLFLFPTSRKFANSGRRSSAFWPSGTSMTHVCVFLRTNFACLRIRN